MQLKGVIMNNQQSISPIYLLNPNATHAQLTEALRACLCKMEALILVAATTDLDSYDSKIINNYLWIGCDLMREAKALFEQTVENI
jgi:hypothetical protein